MSETVTTPTLYRVSVNRTTDHGDRSDGWGYPVEFEIACRWAREAEEDLVLAIRRDPGNTLLTVIGGENETYVDWTSPDGVRHSRTIAIRAAR